MLKDSDFFFICDFETTGIDPNKDYPIELGGLVTDYKFNIITTFDHLIYDSSLNLFDEVETDSNKTYYWRQEYLPAYEVHKIKPYELMLSSITYHSAVNKLNEIYSDLKRKYGCKRFIILSDNAQFEYNFMKRLFELANIDIDFFFHYSAWDTNLLLEAVKPEVGDAVPVHRAFQDATRLYRNLIRALDRTGYFDNMKEV